MAIDLSVNYVLVDLTNPITENGVGHILVRLNREDRELIKHAALAAGLNQATFTRTVLIRTAEKVIRETAKG